jgi:chaperonin GroES
MSYKLVTPLFDNLLIKPMKPEEKSSSGIILPDVVDKEKPQIGEVMEIGKEVTEVKVGDKVMYKKWGGQDIKLDNEEFIIAVQKDILAIIS